MAEPFPPEGLPLVEARQRVLSGLAPLPGEEMVTLAVALGRVSAAALHAPAAVPGFAAAILDGYVIPDPTPPAIGRCWRLVGQSAPGRPFQGQLGPGEAVRILTGAPIPEAGSRVLAQELVEVFPPEQVRLASAPGERPWIRAADEEAAAGEMLLPAGLRLGPAALARLAACGIAALPVRRRPRVGLLVTGDELVPPGQERSPGQIWESNATLLEALLQRMGHAVVLRQVVADDPALLGAALGRMASCCDVLVSTGGVSVGDADWIRPLLAERGRVEFWKLFLRPGRPFAFGHLEGRPFFALPGNPVAAAVTALQLLAPALAVMEGAAPEPLPRMRVRLANRLPRAPGRPELARARLEISATGEPLARVEGSQASSRIGSLLGADLLLEIPAGATVLEPGTPLWAQLLLQPLF